MPIHFVPKRSCGDGAIAPDGPIGPKRPKSSNPWGGCRRPFWAASTRPQLSVLGTGGPLEFRGRLGV
eukprot:383073-Pyramimonas_sp.AAC.1